MQMCGCVLTTMDLQPQQIVPSNMVIKKLRKYEMTVDTFSVWSFTGFLYKPENLSYTTSHSTFQKQLETIFSSENVTASYRKNRTAGDEIASCALIKVCSLPVAYLAKQKVPNTDVICHEYDACKINSIYMLHQFSITMRSQWVSVVHVGGAHQGAY